MKQASSGVRAADRYCGHDDSSSVIVIVCVVRNCRDAVRYNLKTIVCRAVFLFLFAVFISVAAHPGDIDADGDGLPDILENRLIERFEPRFNLSAVDCDIMPAEFQAGIMEPIAVARNGTIYAQVFPVVLPGRDGAWAEVHYYHLWANDCGRMGHKYDVEHISALVSADIITDSAENWEAKYWYAAAHEDTVCDAGNGAKASSLDAERSGATVWISSGKHASFLSEQLCKWGCGGDRCENIARLSVTKMINVGERGTPLNGSLWIDSPLWPMQSKLSSDFTPAMLAQLDNPKLTAARSTNNTIPPLKVVILGGGKTVESLAMSGNKTEEALSLAGDEADSALVTATEKAEIAIGMASKNTDKSIRKLWKAIGDFFGGRKCGK